MWRDASRGTHDLDLQHSRPQSRQILIDRQTAPAIKPRSPFLSPEGTLRLPKTGKSKTKLAPKFFKHARLHGTCPPLCKTIRDVTRLPPGHAFGGLLGGRALTPRRPPRRPPGRGRMAVPILRLPWKQDEPPASPLAGGPSEDLRPHWAAARPGSPSRGPAQQEGIFSSVIKAAINMGNGRPRIMTPGT